MVLDHISNASRYYALGKRFETALRWLEQNGTSDLKPEERIPIDGVDVYATSYHYTTGARDSVSLEGHRRYADIQFNAKGPDVFGYRNILGAVPSMEYDSEMDYQLFTRECDYIVSKEGMFSIYWPEDLHAPRIMDGQPEEVTKVVVKVRL